MKWKLDAATSAKVVVALEALRQTLEEGRTAWDEKSERWQDSDKGINASAWLDEIETVVDALEALPEQAEE